MVEEIKIAEGYKQTEVGVIPDDWGVKKLQNIANIKMGQSPNSKFYNNSKIGLPLIQGNAGIKNRKTIVRNYTSQITKKCYIGDIIMSVRAPVGEIATAICNACIGRGVCAITYENDYLYQYLIYIEPDWKKHSTGSTFDSVNSETIKNLKIPLPPTRTEQTAIATALSDMDDLIEGLEKLLVKKRNIKQGAMQELLSPSAQIMNDELSMVNGKGNSQLKKGWVKKKLGEIAVFLKGKGLPKSDILLDGKVKCIHYGELFLQYNEEIKIIRLRTDKFDGALYSKSNDVLMPTSDVTPFGLATASCLKENNILLGGDILVIRISKEIINGSFLSYFISNNRNQIMKLVKGVTVYHLHASDLKDFVIQYPRIEEQTEIAIILSEMDSEIEKLETQLSKYKMLKTGMMQELLTGKKRLV